MQCTLLIPGLLWPRDTAEVALRGLELPALEQFLARARPQTFAPVTTEGWLCQAFEVERQHDWPIAPLTLELDGGNPADAYWLRADPVHIRIERDRLMLVESALLQVTSGEAQSLIEALDQHFAADGMQFCAPTPKRWYVRVARPPAIVTHSISEVRGQDVQRFLPGGADALAWHGIFNEAQMLLHGHRVNAAREERGEAALNSVWLWGGGTRPPVRGTPFDAVWSNDPTGIALASLVDTHAAPLPAHAAAWQSESAELPAGASHLLVMHELADAAAYRDVEGWQARLVELETRWFAPLVKAIRDGQVSALALVVPGAGACCRFDLARGDLFRFWRRGKPLSAYA